MTFTHTLSFIINLHSLHIQKIHILLDSHQTYSRSSLQDTCAYSFTTLLSVILANFFTLTILFILAIPFNTPPPPSPSRSRDIRAQDGLTIKSKLNQGRRKYHHIICATCGPCHAKARDSKRFVKPKKKKKTQTKSFKKISFAAPFTVTNVSTRRKQP